MGNSWQTRAEDKRNQRDRAFLLHLQTIEQEFKKEKLTDRVSDDISRLNVYQLVQKLNTFEITSYQLVLIYSRRTGRIGKPQMNAVTEDNFIAAMQMAKQCDKVRKETKKTNWRFGDQWNMEKFLPPLFGVPMSIKDTFDMKGFATTLGIVNRINKIQQNQGSIMAVTRYSGIIPFVRTNLPQLGMSAQCFNNLWGRTNNPWNRNRTPGGSSGGQAALVASRCSPIGTGSDIAGSLRIPSDFCGLFTIKAHSQRISSCGHNTFSLSFNGNNNIPVTVGPITKSPQDCALWMKTYCCKQLYNGDHDPYSNIKEFDDQLYKKSCENKKMRIGYIRRLEILQPSLATQRAIEETINMLKSLGHQLIQVQIPNQSEIIRASSAQFVAEGQELKSYKEMLKDEPIISDYSLIELSQKKYLKPLTWFLYKVCTLMYPRLATIMKNGQPMPTVHQYLVHGGNMKMYRKQWVNYLRQHGIDLVIAPGFGCNAYNHGAFSEALAAAAYTLIWNCLDVPAGSVPITVVRRDQQQYASQYSDMLTSALRKNAEDSQGLPAGIQVVGLPFKQQAVLGLMQQIETQNKFYEKHRLP